VNYTELTTNIADICATTFTADQYAMFTQQAEQKIYSTVYLPALRKAASAAFTISDPYVTFPTDLLYVYSLAVVDGTGAYSFLLSKEPDFIREAYPTPTSTGLPKQYGFYGPTQFIVGPTPDATYTYKLDYGYYPESLVTASTTWLGEQFDSALLNGALVEAIRFMKGEPDLVALYEKMFVQAVGLLKNLADGKMKQDMYRSGTPHQKPG